MIRALVCSLCKVVHDEQKFELVCNILSEDNNKELVKSVALVYCILKCEMYIVEETSYNVMYPVLKEQLFFKHYEETILQSENTVKKIVDILKDKETDYFNLFLCCLKQMFPSVFTKIKNEWNNFIDSYNHQPTCINNLSTGNVQLQCATSDSFKKHLIATYTGRSFQDRSAGLDNKHTFVFPMLIEFKDEKSINCNKIFYEQDSHMTISTCFEIFNKGHRVVLLQGTPGSGKTTIAYQICKEWTEGKLEMFSHVVVMRLEDDRVAKCKNVEEFIQLLIGSEKSIEVASEIRKTHGEGVLLILEGWDHLLPKQRRNSLFTDLVKGQVFAKATVAITGRPSACLTLPYQFINCKIQIFGFKKCQVEEYVKCSCRNHPDGVQVMQKIQSQPDVFHCRLICIPANLCIIVTILKEIDINSSLSITKLYKLFLLYLLNRHKQDIYGDNRKIKHFASLPSDLPHEMFKMLQNLARMAYDNLQHDNVTFDEEEIRKCCFESKKAPQHFDGMGLLQVVNSICLYVERTFQFIHQNLQELLAAWHLSQQTISFQQQHYQLFSDKEMFCLFYEDFVPLDFIEDATRNRISPRSNSSSTRSNSSSTRSNSSSPRSKSCTIS